MKNSRMVMILCVGLLLGGVWCYKAGNSAKSRQEDVGAAAQTEQADDYIKWVEFNVTCEAMKKAYQYDLDTYGGDIHLNWVDLLAYLGAKYGGDFARYREADIDEAAELLLSGKKTVEDLAAEMQYYDYYREAYGAVLDGMVGAYEMEYALESGNEEGQTDENTQAGTENRSDTDTLSDDDAPSDAGSDAGTQTAWKQVYGLKAYHPIAKGFPYSDYDDFGVSRTYGYRRNHLGHDMMGQVGTPVIAVESGYVAELGWNQYGGWRVGINSFDGKRYYYYAHLRQDRPFAEGLEKGEVVAAGDVIGYMGRTGYSTEENVNNIDEYHLHFGLQLIFDESQRDGNNEIWVSGYELVKFLYQHQSEVQRDDATKEWTRIYQIKDPAVNAEKD